MSGLIVHVHSFYSRFYKGPLLIALMLAAGCQHYVQFYPGPHRDAPLIARVYQTDDVIVSRVDDTWVKKKLKLWQPVTDYPRTWLELEPGEHRLTVSKDDIEWEDTSYWTTDSDGNSQYVSDYTPYVVRLSANFMTMVYDFEAGKSYTFKLSSDPASQPSNGSGNGSADSSNAGKLTWAPLLVESGSNVTLATRETKPPADWLNVASTNGATVSGQAAVELPDVTVITATGRRVMLLPDTDDAWAWIHKTDSYNVSKWKLLAPSLPAAVGKQTRMTVGIAQGQYRFDNVPAGSYVLVFPFKYNKVAYLSVVSVVVAENERQATVGAVQLRTSK